MHTIEVPLKRYASEQPISYNMNAVVPSDFRKFYASKHKKARSAIHYRLIYCIINDFH